MIDDFIIFSKTGLVLFRYAASLAKDPLDQFIKTVLLEERYTPNTSYQVESWRLCCRIRNDLEVVFCCIYQGILHLTYLDVLLENIISQYLVFLKKTQPEVMGRFATGNFGNVERARLDLRPAVGFGVVFEKVKSALDREHLLMKKNPKMRQFESGDQKTGGGGGSAPGGGGEQPGEGEDDGKDGKKKKRVAAGDMGTTIRKRVTAQDMAKLDMSAGKNKSSSPSDSDDALNQMREQFMPSDDESDEFDEQVELVDFAQLEEQRRVVDTTNNKSWFGQKLADLKGYTQGRQITENDLQPVLAALREQLMNKNVAKEVADNLTQAVARSLIGTTTQAYTTLQATVQKALCTAIAQLLTPKQSVDVMRAALQAKAQGRTYSIVFLGVNGVGKSTNLAKVAYYLKQKGGLSVLIAACDTFRAGAVEQLKQHARCLDVQLFEKGYGKDPAEIARNAIGHANRTGIDVVLIDTAGRMQGNLQRVV